MMSLKKITLWASALVLGLAGVACSGTAVEEETTDLLLKVNKISFVADDADAVTFTVLNGVVDVTSEAVIRCKTNNTIVSGASFSATQAGTYKFEASLGSATSPTIEVTATEAPHKASQFVRHICIMEFTGQWCAHCPAGYNYLNFFIERYYKKVAHVIAMHDNSTSPDIFALPVQLEIARAFSIVTYPYALVDLRASGPLSDDSASTLEKNITASQKEYPAHCGVALKSVYNESTKSTTVSARIFSEKTEAYKLAVYVLEDGLVAEQNNGGMIVPNYTHNHVARRLVSASYKGDSMGEIKSGQEAVKDYVINIDPAWNLDKTSVFALAIGANGYVNNMMTCKIVNGDADYHKINQ